MNTATDLETIRAQARKIAESGVLGRSRFYSALLEFLVACAEQNRTPKEIEIAAEVFNRGSGFDPSQDSMVRVYAHNLRQKLQQFYTGEGKDETVQITVPKGEYRIALATPEPPAEPEPAPVSSRRPGSRFDGGRVARVAGILLLGVMLGAGAERGLRQAPPEPSAYAAVAASPLWNALFDDELPIIVAVGDYYIFGELDERENVARLVREFSINSSRELDDLLMFEPALRYIDLDLTYLSTGTAVALRDVLRVLYTSDKAVRVVAMSDLNVADFKTNHVVYVGWISALDKLLDFVFASSALSVGDTFDELVDKSEGITYMSGAGLPAGRRNYIDYGLFSTFPGPSGNQFSIITGTRDAGLMQSAQAVSGPMYFRSVAEAAFGEPAAEQRGAEVLFEVTGYDRTNLDAMIVHTGPLDYREIWGGELQPAD